MTAYLQSLGMTEALLSLFRGVGAAMGRCITLLSTKDSQLNDPFDAGLLMTAYLKSLGMTEAVLSLFRGVGAVTGVAATFTYPLLHRKLGAPLNACHLVILLILNSLLSSCADISQLSNL